MGARQHLVTDMEKFVAQKLQAAKIDYEYEPKEFTLYFGGESVRAFRPDFYLTQAKMYVEVGNLRSKDYKLKRMRSSYPNVRVVVIDNKWQERLEKIAHEDFAAWLMETWVEQEYIDVESVQVRCEARLLSRQPVRERRPSRRKN